MAAVVSEPSHCCIPMDEPIAAKSTASGTKPAVQWETAEKQLNCFVGVVALLERTGNCLGTLAFTWATVVVLGGFSTNLGRDFWYATAIVFLEAFRVFSRESRSDDELLFKTTGSISLKRMKISRGIPYYLTVGIVMVCLYGILEFPLRYYGYTPPQHLRLQYHCLLLSALLVLASLAQAPTAAEYVKDHVILQSTSALVAVLALGGAMILSHTPKRQLVLIIPPLFVGCLQYSVVKAIGACLKNSGCHLYKLPYWLRTLGSLILPAWIVISVVLEFGIMGILILLGTLLLGNIQIPVALARVVLSSVRLFGKDNNQITGNEHLEPALTIFYSMVLAQGILYLAACILESLLSRHFRRSLAETCDLTYSKGYESIDLYYEHAYNKRMEEGVLAQEDMNLVNFAVNSLDSNSRDKKLAAVQILHSLLQLQGASNTGLVSKITTSPKVVASLINMLGWTASHDQGISIRLFATKVIASLARDLRIVGIPGTIQMLSSLLDVDAKNQVAKQDISIQTLDKNEVNIDDNQKRSHGSSTTMDIQGEHGYHAPTDGEGLSKQVEAGQKCGKNYEKIKFLGCINDMLHGPQEGEDPSMDMNLFPLLGMLILERLVHDLDNFVEISKATGLIVKIIGFISDTTDTTNITMTSSLKLVAKLTSTKGEIGMTLRQKILEQHFLVSNLVEILVDNTRHPKQWELAMIIIGNLILEDQTSKDIERFHVIIPELMHAFLHQGDRSLRMVAGEALSKLSRENISYCLAILEEKGYGLIDDLNNMLQKNEYTYVAASLLSNLCAHSQDKLHHPRYSEQISSVLRVVLKKMVDTEGKQLEVLIVTASKLHNLIPEQFAYELESLNDEEKLVQKLVGALNSNKKMCQEYPRMRRVVVEITVSIMESCPRYSTIFKNKRMMEALSNVERTSSKVQKYRAFLGDAGVVFDSGLPPPDLVAEAKRLIGSETPNQGFQVHDSSSMDIVHVD